MGGGVKLEAVDRCLASGILLGRWLKEVCDCKLVAES